jgi:large subunit ribosomal protein L16
MFNPPNIQYFKKKHKYNIKGKEYRTSMVRLGSFGLKVLEEGYITTRQIDASKKTIVKQIKKIGILYVRVYPNLGITTKPAETRMGKGKGNINYWVVPVRKGKIIFEVSGIPEDKAKEVFLLVANKLPFKTKIIKK